MKYCAFCGNEMHDEAILCVKCKRFIDGNKFREVNNLTRDNNIKNNNIKKEKIDNTKIILNEENNIETNKEKIIEDECAVSIDNEKVPYSNSKKYYIQKIVLGIIFIILWVLVFIYSIFLLHR